ncbi:MAG: flagellar hook-length control protein FliK, partial [Ruminococcus sp.]|nr:flagellar hook-length control protein FliK [Ruminococcus sp.]
MSAGDNAAVDTADGLLVNAFALGNETAQKAVETFTETVSEILSEGGETAESLLKFCGEVAKELNAQIVSESEKSAPEDIHRQAFMARVTFAESVSEETPIAGVEAALRLGNVSEESGNVVETDAGGNADDVRANVTAENAAESISDNIGNDSGEVSLKAGSSDMSDRSDIAALNAAAVERVSIERGVEAEETDSDVPVSLSDTAEIARRISDMVSRGREESITIRLDPAELGEIKVTVSRKAGETAVAFETQKSESAQLLGDRAAALAETLAQKGIAVREISVTDNSPRRQDESEGHGQFYGESRQSQSGENSHGGYSRRYYFEEPEETPTADENYFYSKEADLWLSV